MADDDVAFAVMQEAAELGMVVARPLRERPRDRRADPAAGGGAAGSASTRCPRSRPIELEAECVHRFLVLAGLAGADAVRRPRHRPRAARRDRGRAAPRRRPCTARCARTTCCSSVADHGAPDGAALRDDAAAAHGRRPGGAARRACGRATLDTYASDHCHLRLDRDKVPVADDFTKVPTGLPGIGARLPLGFALGGDDPLAVERLVRGRLHAPARIFGLYPRKGVIARGQRRRHRRVGSRRRRARLTLERDRATGWTGRPTTASRCPGGCATCSPAASTSWPTAAGTATGTRRVPARRRVLGRRSQPAVQPPSTVTMLPDMKPTSSDSRKAMVAAISSGRPERPTRLRPCGARPLALGQLGRRRRATQHRRVDRARADAVDADALAGVVDRHRPRQPDHAPPSTRSTRGWPGSRPARTARRR